MQSANIDGLVKLIDESDDIIVALITSDGCEQFQHKIITDYEELLSRQHIPASVYKLCYSEDALPFPRPHTPAVYYFAPKKHTPLFYRLAQQMTMDVQADIRTAKAMSLGSNYLDAAFEPTIKEHIQRTEDMVNNEDLTKFPPFFQQMRNLGKEMWHSSKNAIRGLPVLVSADEAFARISICQSCEFYKDDSRCEKCGCFMRTKCQLASASCPIGKWKNTV